MPRNRTRRNKTEGGSNCGMKLNGGKRRNKTEGGKLGDAMKRASALKKKGQL